MIIFNGYKLANEKEAKLKLKLRDLSARGLTIKIAAILFAEDAGSQLYTGLKREAAQRVGIEYEVHEFSLKDEASEVIKLIKLLNQDKSITGIIIQKPTRQVWQEYQVSNIKYPISFENWWQGLTSQIKLEKDVDGLHPENTRLLPATVRAVLTIIQYPLSNISLSDKKILILNRSDILGKPLYYKLKNWGLDVQIWGSKDLENQYPISNVKYPELDFDLIISGTGRANLITGDMIKKGVVLIDVGEPRGDVDFDSVKSKASFITPVPGGVGPMTVISLLENAIKLVLKK